MFNQPNSLPPLPGDIISEINTLVNQNQLYIEMLALKHCELQRRLNCTIGYENKPLQFSRRRDLRFMFECGEQILAHYMEKEYQHYSQTLAIDRRMSISVKHYVVNLLETFVESALSHSDIDEGSIISECPSAAMSITSSISSRSSTSSIRSSSSSRSSLRERDAVYDSEHCVEVQLEHFVPSVSFSDRVQCFEF